MNTNTLKTTFLDSLCPVDEFNDLSISDFSTDQLNALCSISETICGQIESYIYNNPELREYFENDKSYGSSNIEYVSFYERDITLHMEEAGCHCCPKVSFTRTIPIEWITEEAWKVSFAKIAAEKAAEEKKKRLEKKRKVKEATERKEEKDRTEYKRLQKKFGNKA